MSLVYFWSVRDFFCWSHFEIAVPALLILINVVLWMQKKFFLTTRHKDTKFINVTSFAPLRKRKTRV